MSLHGELDFAVRGLLSHGAAAFAVRCITSRRTGSNNGHEAFIDAADLRFVDAAALGELVALQQTLAAAGIRLSTRNAPAGLRRISAICGLDAVLGVEPASRIKRPASDPPHLDGIVD